METVEWFDSRADRSRWQLHADGTATVGGMRVSAMGYEQARALHRDWYGGTVNAGAPTEARD